MKNIVLNGKIKKSYIYIESQGLTKAKEIISNHFAFGKIHIITDSNVDPLYSSILVSQFDVVCSKTVITAGEQSKTLDTVGNIYHDLQRNQITKGDLIIALGGGVVGDIAGFVSATYLRGVEFCQIPTSLLAQVDSSVGGKCGVDLPYGKNLVGVINQPTVVLIDPSLIKTLTTRYFNDGMAEVIKYGYILDSSLLESIAKLADENILTTDMSLMCEMTTNVSTKFYSLLEGIITRCVQLKADIVEQDEDDSGIRKILNFGHTIGHAIEKLGNFNRYSHGEAVSIGMVKAVSIGKQYGYDIDDSRMIDLLQKFSLPTNTDYDMNDIYNALQSDKKIDRDTLSFILLEQDGVAIIKPIKLDELKI